MVAFVTAGAGFLIAVLWFDLMFDVQVLGHRDERLPEEVLASIGGYYRRVTTAARPMNRLVALVMITMVTAIVIEIVDMGVPGWVGWASLGLASAAIGLAAVRTVPSAVRLGARIDSAERQSALARAILREHVLCAVAIATLLALQLSSA